MDLVITLLILSIIGTVLDDLVFGLWRGASWLKTDPIASPPHARYGHLNLFEAIIEEELAWCRLRDTCRRWLNLIGITALLAAAWVATSVDLGPVTPSLSAKGVRHQ